VVSIYGKLVFQETAKITLGSGKDGPVFKEITSMMTDISCCRQTTTNQIKKRTTLEKSRDVP